MNGHLRNNFKFYILLFLFLSNFFIWAAVLGFDRHSGLKVFFLDVGQGDSIFIDGPSECWFCQNKQILIDAGPGSNILAPLSKAMPFYDKTIDLAVMTHPQYDHISGFVEILKRYKVGAVMLTGADSQIKAYEEIKNIIQKNGIEAVYAKTGQYADLGKGAIFQILYPKSEPKTTLPKNLNDSSIIAKLSYGKTSFLFTGDAGPDEEKEILKARLNIKSDVLKVAHHGSKFSSTEEFLKALEPKMAVIQSGANNPYGHPHPLIVSKLSALGTKIFRNDTDGTIILSSDGKTITSKTEK